MVSWIQNTYFLGRKEISSLLRDSTLVFFVFYCFTFLVYTESTGVKTEINNASIAIVDQDHSTLSRRIADAFQPPYFKPIEWIDATSQQSAMEHGRFSFILHIKSGFEKDMLRGLHPDIQLNVDATGIAHAGIGASYIERILFDEVRAYLQENKLESAFPVQFVVRALYNPNLDSVRYQSIMSLVEQITLITLLLVGTAVIRESERGTLEHLMVLPLSASQIAFAKILASTLFVITGAAICLVAVIETILQVPLHGSHPLFFAATFVYMFVISALAIFLATMARTMPQYGLLATPVFLVLMLLSGAYSPLESMPELLQTLLEVSPTLQFVKICQAILFRGATLDMLLSQIIMLGIFGTISLSVAMYRFKKHLVSSA